MIDPLTNRHRELLIQANSYDMLATRLRHARVNHPQDRQELKRLNDFLEFVVGRMPCFVEDVNREERIADFYFDNEGRFVKK